MIPPGLNSSSATARTSQTPGGSLTMTNAADCTIEPSYGQVLLVIEDPGKKRTERFRNLQTSHAKSHAATAVHARRRAGATKQTNPYELIPNFIQHVEFLCYSKVQRRSLDYFRVRTATELSGWIDAEYWQCLALRLSATERSVRHALIALGAFHESLTGRTNGDDKQLTALADKEAHRAMTLLNSDVAGMSEATLLSTNVVFSMLIWFVADNNHYKMLKQQNLLLDNLRQGCIQIPESQKVYIEQYLGPMIDRQQARYGAILDLAYALRNSPASNFYLQREPIVPSKFVSWQNARQVLESSLNWTTYLVKTRLSTAEDTVQEEIKHNLNTYLLSLYSNNTTLSWDVRDRYQVLLLDLSAQFGFMLIKYLLTDEHDECFFDAFTNLYAALANAFREVLEYYESVARLNVSFGFETSFVGLVSNTAWRWCRDPQIRRDLIQLLHRSQRRESLEGAVVSAKMCEWACVLEESGINPPPQTCHDIPIENRVKIDLSRFWVMRSQHIRFSKYPFGRHDFEDVYIPHKGCGSTLDKASVRVEGDNPELILGRGFVSFLEFDQPQQYYTIKTDKFCFPILRV